MRRSQAAATKRFPFWKTGGIAATVAAILKLPFSLFLALRYLKPKRTFLSIITLISVIGVTLGVTVLILVISVMTGFDRELQRKVIDFDAHILVSTEDVMRDWRELTVKLHNTPGVVATAPFVQGPVRSEERRVGKECWHVCRSRWSPYH